MLVAGAPAHVPGKTHSDFFFGGIGVSLQKFTGAQEKSGSAESTLQAVILPEALLQGMKFAVCGQSLNGRDLRAIGLHCKHQARPYCMPVHEDRAGSANPMFTAHVGAPKVQVFAQEVGQESPGLDLLVVGLSIDGDFYGSVGLRHVSQLSFFRFSSAASSAFLIVFLASTPARCFLCSAVA